MKYIFYYFIIIFTLIVTVCYATSANNTQNITFTNGTAVELTLIGQDVNFGRLTPNVSSEMINTSTITCGANTNWTLTVSGTDFDSIPIERLAIKLNDNEYQNVTTYGTALVVNHSKGFETYQISHKLTTNFSDSPTLNSTTIIIFTLSTI